MQPGKTLHSHDWVDVATWTREQIAEHWVGHHNNVEGRLPAFTADSLYVQYLTEDTALVHHQLMHYNRHDGTRPPVHLVTAEWLRQEILRVQSA